jgi:hypothetical protein
MDLPIFIGEIEHLYVRVEDSRSGYFISSVRPRLPMADLIGPDEQDEVAERGEMNLFPEGMRCRFSLDAWS